MNQSIDDLLLELHSNTPVIEGSSLITRDGLVLASNYPTDLDEDRIAALSADMHSVSAYANKHLLQGDLNEVTLKFEHGALTLYKVGLDLILKILTKKDTLNEEVSGNMDETINKIHHILG